MKTLPKHIPSALLEAHTLSSYSVVIPPAHLMLNGALFRQHRPQELFTNFQLFPSMQPDASIAMPGRSHQIEG
ncbi:hypothetical protein QYM18_05945 [Ectopseudomonas chengduensis]|nr:hypothetical protein [Pseudomonas chengduensis]WKC38629.1 hypothetical protein QYM18_05945 [Pseudomonas chengduensis]